MQGWLQQPYFLRAKTNLSVLLILRCHISVYSLSHAYSCMLINLMCNSTLCLNGTLQKRFVLTRDLIFLVCALSIIWPFLRLVLHKVSKGIKAMEKMQDSFFQICSGLAISSLLFMETILRVMSHTACDSHIHLLIFLSILKHTDQEKNLT